MVQSNALPTLVEIITFLFGIWKDPLVFGIIIFLYRDFGRKSSKSWMSSLNLLNSKPLLENPGAAPDNICFFTK